MTSVSELRNITLKARGENSNSRLEQYTKARDEAFDLMTDSVMDRIKDAAGNGKFRYPIYRWENSPRFQKNPSEGQKESADPQKDSADPQKTPSEEVEQHDDAKVFFGNSSDGKNGLHIMSLINPKGIDRQHSLITKLREFFNSGSEPSADEERRDNQLKIYFEPHPINFRKCAIFVSWDRKQIQRPTYGGGTEAAEMKRSPTKNGGAVSERFASLNAAVVESDSTATAPVEKKRFVARCAPRAGYVKRA